MFFNDNKNDVMKQLRFCGRILYGNDFSLKNEEEVEKLYEAYLNFTDSYFDYTKVVFFKVQPCHMQFNK